MSRPKDLDVWIKELSNNVYSNRSRKVIFDFENYYSINVKSFPLIEFVEKIKFCNKEIEDQFVDAILEHCSTKSVIWNLLCFFKTKKHYVPFEKCCKHFIKCINTKDITEKTMPSLSSRYQCLFIEIVANMPSNTEFLRTLLINGFGYLIQNSLTEDLLLNLLQEISVPTFKLFQLTFKLSPTIAHEFIDVICETIEDKKYFRNVENKTFFALTKLIAEFFSDRSKSEYLKSAKNGLKVLNNLQLKATPGELAIKCFMSYLIEKKHKDFSAIFEIMAKSDEQINYDTSLTISSIMYNISEEYIETINLKDYELFRQLFDLVCKYLKQSITNKMLCSHCSSSKRHAIIWYVQFLIKALSTIHKNKLCLDSKVYLANEKIVNYVFKLFADFNCSTVKILILNVAISVYNFINHLSNDSDLSIKKSASKQATILLDNIIKYNIKLPNIDEAVILRIIGECYLGIDLGKYLKILSFVVVCYEAKSMNYDILLYKLLQNVYSDDVVGSEKYETIPKIAEAIPDELLGLKKPAFEAAHILGKMLLSISNYQSRRNIRKVVISELFEYSQKFPLLVASYFVHFERYEKEHIDPLKDLIKYNEASETCDHIVTSILKYRVFCEEIKLIQNQQKNFESHTTESNDKDKHSESNQNYTTLEMERNCVNALQLEMAFLSDYLKKGKIVDVKLYDILCDVLDSIGTTFQIRKFTLDAVNCFKILYKFATQTKNAMGIIKSFIFFANNSFLLQSINNSCPNEIPPIEELVKIYKQTIATLKTQKTNQSKLILLAHLAYTKYLLDSHDTQHAIKMMNNIKLSFGTEYFQNDQQGKTVYSLIFHSCLLYLTLLTSSIVSSLNHLVQSFFRSIKEIVYTSTTEFNHFLIAMFETIEFLCEYQIEKHSSFATAHNIALKFAYKICAPQRIVVLIKTVTGHNIARERYDDVDAINKKLNHIVNFDTNLSSEVKTKTITDVTPPSTKASDSTCKTSVKMPWQKLTESSAICANVRRNKLTDAYENRIFSPPPSISALTNCKSNHDLKCTCEICKRCSTLQLQIFDLNLIFAHYNIMENNFIVSQEIYQNSLRYVEKKKVYAFETHKDSPNINLLNIAAIKVIENEATLFCATCDYENSEKRLLNAIELVCNLRSPFMEGYLNKLRASLMRVHQLQQIECQQVLPTPKLAKQPKFKLKSAKPKSAAPPKFTINVDESSPLRSVSPVATSTNSYTIPISPENILASQKKVKRTPRLKNKLKLVDTPKIPNLVIVLDDSDDDVSPVSAPIKSVQRKIAVSKSSTKSKSSRLTVKINEIGSQISPRVSRRRRI